MYSKFIMKSPGGKTVRFNNVSYKIPCTITINTEAESTSLEKYFKACGYDFEVQKSPVKASNKKAELAKGDNAKPAPSKSESVKVAEPIVEKKVEPVVEKKEEIVEPAIENIEETSYHDRKKKSKSDITEDSKE